MRATIEDNVDYLDWAFRLDRGLMSTISRYIRENILTMREVLEIADTYEVSEISDEYNNLFNDYVDMAYNKYKVLAVSR